MDVIFVRHGEPTYEHVGQRGFIGHGRDLAQLTAQGKAQARAAAADPRLQGIALIVSSPYTRALETAAIISRATGAEIAVELDLHEWLPDLKFTYNSGEASEKAAALCAKNGGLCPKGSKAKYEELPAVRKRAERCLEKYRHFGKIIAVTHGVVMKQFGAPEDIPYCGIMQVAL